MTNSNIVLFTSGLFDYIYAFFVQFLKLFLVLRRPEDFSTKWPPKMSRDLVAMTTQLKNLATYATNHVTNFQRLPSHILGDIEKPNSTK